MALLQPVKHYILLYLLIILTVYELSSNNTASKLQKNRETHRKNGAPN